ncbi:MAG: hypothetical protein JST92_16005, partial [Deltaproteobacteria bacterium]|nr:hypothetical protein [Deltaproteobacteria bacterium]
QGHTLLLDLAVGGVLLLYAYLRVRLGWPVPGLAPIDLAVTLGGALLLVFLERGVRRARPAFVPSFLRYACALPLFALWTAPLDQRATVALGCALVFGLIAWLHRQDRASLLAAVAAIAFVNVSLLTTWVQRGVSDEQLYTIPLGFSLLVAAHISRGELQRQQLQWLRGLGCIVLYAGSALQIARSDGLMFPLVLGLLSLLTVAAGALLCVRVFLYFGLATLVLDVLANLLRYSARSRPVLAAVATGTGLLVIVVMTVLSVKRAQAVALYRRLVSTMEAWE